MKQGAETRTRRSLALYLGALALATASACKQTVLFDETTGGSFGGGGNGGNGGGHDDGGDNDASPPFCMNPQAVTFSPEAADVIVALDRAMGMSNTLFGTSGTSTRLSAAEAALESAVQLYHNVVRFGFVPFPGDVSNCGTADPDCCAGDVAQPSLIFDSFDMSLKACDMSGTCAQGGDRALSEALGACKDFYRSDTEPVARYVLVVTDGPPGCPAPNSNNCDSGAMNAVTALGNNSVRTIVMQLMSNSGNQDPCLQKLAQAGGGMFYSAFTPDYLTQKLQSILGPIAGISCSIDLVLQAPATSADSLQLLDNTTNLVIPPISQSNPTNGWTFGNGSGFNIVLLGTACNTFIQYGRPSLKIYSCQPHHNGP